MSQRNDDAKHTAAEEDAGRKDDTPDRQVLIRQFIDVIQGRVKLSAVDFIELVRAVNAR